MDNIKVSVAVAIYNVAPYLRKCLESLRNQTLQDIEFILIDDGSKDDSGIICDEYANLDSRFHVIHKENGGVSTVRQVALETASGDYIVMCDGDDWVEHDMYESMYQRIVKANADMCVCGFRYEYPDKSYVVSLPSFPEKCDVVCNIDLVYTGLYSLWSKLIRRQFLIDNDINFTKGIDMAEDALVLMKVMKCNPKVVQLTRDLYHYRRDASGGGIHDAFEMEEYAKYAFCA